MQYAHESKLKMDMDRSKWDSTEIDLNLFAHGTMFTANMVYCTS